MSLPNRQPLRAGFWSLLLLSVWAWAPATYPGYWRSLEGFVPIFNVGHLGSLAAIGVAPDLWRGAGSAAFLLARPLLFLGVAPVTAVRTSFVISFLLGGVGIYLWLRTRLGDRAAGLAGVIYMFAPPFLATVYIRGSLSDALVLGVLPLALAGLAIYAENRATSAGGIALLALLWIWQAQAGLAIFATLLLFGYGLWVERQFRVVLIVIMGSVAGLASMIPLWSITASSPVNFFDHFVYFFQFFQNGWEVAPSIPGWEDDYPLQLGLAPLLLSILSLWFWWMRPAAQPLETGTDVGRLLGFCVVGCWLLGALTLNLSAPFWIWTGAGRLLTYPWQLLLVAMPLLAMTAGALPALHLGFTRMPQWAILLGVTLLGSYNYLTADFTQYLPPSTPVATFGAHSEILILDARLNEDPIQRRTELQVTWQALHLLTVDYNIFFQALRGDAQAVRVEAQLDSQPFGGERPATSWQPGEIFTDTYHLDLKTVTNLAGLRYHFGYYDWRNGARLPLDRGVDDKLVFYGQ